MNIFVLDSSAVLRYVDDEAGADRLEAIFLSCGRDEATTCISAIQWGEVARIFRQRYGAVNGKRAFQQLDLLRIKIVSASADRVVRAAEISVDCKISLADSIAAELALDSADHVLVTADFDFKAVKDLIQIEFLPAK